MRILVTGGAGFIGSNFVRHTLLRLLRGVRGRQGRRRGQADVRRDHGEPGLRRRRPAAGVRPGRHLRRLADVAADPGASPWSCTSRPRPTSTARSRRGADFVATNVRGHPDAAGGLAARRRRHVRAGLHGRGLRIHRVRARWVESHPLRTQLARTRPPRRRPTCWRGRSPHLPLRPCSITRCPNNYGPYQFPEKVIPLFVTNLLDGEPGAAVRRRPARARVDARRRPLPGHRPGAWRGRPGEVYNIGGNAELTNRELTGPLLDIRRGGLVDGRPGGGPARARPPLLRRQLQDHGRLGYRPLTPFDGGPGGDGPVVRARTAAGGSR